MAFTTWAALKTKIENDMDSGAWRVQSYSTESGGSTTYHSLAEMQDYYEYVCKKAEKEASSFASRRTQAKNGGSF